MTMQNVAEPAEAPAEPSKPRLERASDQPRRAGSTESLVDAALEALADPVEPAVDEKQPQRAKRDREEPEQPEADEPALEGGEAGDDGDDAEGEQDPEHAEQDTRGSQEDPFTVKDLPDDKFIEVKVDGQKTIVPLSELASGYIRQQTFSKHLNESKQLTERAQAMVQAAQAFPEKLREQFRAWTQDPTEVLAFFLDSDDREEVLAKVAEHYARMRIAHRERPELRLQFQRERDLRKISAERERLEQQKQAEMQARQAEESRQKALSIWTPGWNEGLRRAGFPTPTPALQEEVMLRCQQRVQSGRLVTSDDIAEFVVRACKLLELPRQGDKHKPKPAPQPVRREARPANTNGRKDWDKVPRHQRVKSADFFLSGLKPRDFR